MSDHHITFDLDWCSDDVLDYVSSLLLQAKKKATWFATHRSSAVDCLCDESSFEIGIHPNFFEGSSHGTCVSSVFDHITTLFPDANAMRTHGLYQSTPMLFKARSEYGITVDVSLLLPYHTGLTPVVPLSCGMGVMHRLPYFWEDDIEMLNKYSDFNFRDKRHHLQGMKIYDFHPVHVALNISSFDHYLRLREIRPIPEWDRQFIFKNQKKGKGALSFLEDMLSVIDGEMTMSQIIEGER